MIRFLLPFLVACGAHPPAPAEEAQPAERTQAPEPTVTKEPALAHPGTVVFVDLDANTSHEEPADSLPETIAWVTVDGERVAVTRVESQKRGNSREIKKYGADGTLLETTISTPQPQ